MTGAGTTAQGLLGVTCFHVPGPILDETLRVLTEVGRKGHEAFVVWGGRLSADRSSLHFSSMVVPAQRAHRTPDGLLVTVDGASLFEVNKGLYERGEILAGQVHSHPTEAFHSDTDDHHPLVTLLGALSLVVPDFAVAGRRGMRRWAWYRLARYGQWVSIDPSTTIRVDG